MLITLNNMNSMTRLVPAHTLLTLHGHGSHTVEQNSMLVLMRRKPKLLVCFRGHLSSVFPSHCGVIILFESVLVHCILMSEEKS